MGKFYYGGQAVMEGVMMRGPKTISIAVRKEDKSLIVHKEDVTSIGERFPILKKPFIRGTVSLVESLVIGMKALTFSANQFASEDEQEELSPKEMVLTLGLSFGLAILLFVVLPAFLTRLIGQYMQSTLLINFVEGLIKLVLFLLYIVGISFLSDIKRFFQYHGAEHKVINAYEAGEELTVENVRKHSRFHMRCGTNFITIVLILNIFIFTLVTGGARLAFFPRVGAHLLLIPVVAGVSYEVLRFLGKEDAPNWAKALARPGLATQIITTREPDDSQIETAILALKEVMGADQSSNEKAIV
ncbi:MAG: DUF1385 domain-containing protein [Bacillota bacterium]|jgi:uncharacterized protein YqhQ|nr:DUF1385 domain-containing protein [Bacillota bacterium]NLU55701.1 DUF1385 domain-containing protein [Bacillota bacterium]HOA90234.1 DUF1385 domain-containing protein [Bacillota bacterium]HOJ46265.1 DUF1385 domain-containing protein [Bacillota bacterium]HOL12840.1 DUF1385 domain-containing protein [Bacillota bacterium]